MLGPKGFVQFQEQFLVKMHVSVKKYSFRKEKRMHVSTTRMRLQSRMKSRSLRNMSLATSSCSFTTARTGTFSCAPASAAQRSAASSRHMGQPGRRTTKTTAPFGDHSDESGRAGPATRPSKPSSRSCTAPSSSTVGPLGRTPATASAARRAADAGAAAPPGLLWSAATEQRKTAPRPVHHPDTS